MLWGLSPCSLLPDGERKQHLDFLSPAGGLGGAGAFLSSSVSSRRGLGDGLGVGGRWEPSPSPQSSALGHGGGSAVPCAPLLQLRASLAPCGGEGARPRRLITVTQELGSAGTEETECGTSQAIPNPMELRPWELLPITELVWRGPDHKKQREDVLCIGLLEVEGGMCEMETSRGPRTPGSGQRR